MPKRETVEETSEQRKKVLEAREKHKVHVGKTGITFQIPDLYKGKLKTQEEIQESLKRVEQAESFQAIQESLSEVLEFVQTQDIALDHLIKYRDEIFDELRGKIQERFNQELASYVIARINFENGSDELASMLKTYSQLVQINKQIHEQERKYVKRLNRVIDQWQARNNVLLETAKGWEQVVRELADVAKRWNDVIDKCYESFYRTFPETKPSRWQQKQRKRKT